MSEWKKPGPGAGLLYAVAAILLGGVVTVFSRLRVAKFRGRRKVARGLPPGGIIVVSNHASYADGVLLALLCRRMGRSLRLLATAGVFRAPVIGGLATRLGFIPVERGSANAADALRPAAEALAAGEAVGIFPEGRTTRNPEQWPERAKTGAVRLALMTGAPIIPIAMVGTHRVLDHHRPVSSILKNLILRPEVLTEVGDPINVRALLEGAETDPVEIRRLADQVMSQVVKLVEELRGEIAPSPHGVEQELDESA